MARTDKYWQHDFRTNTRPGRPVPEDGQHHCSRGEWCASSVIVTEDGETRREPAYTFQSFCPRDREHVAAALDDLPDLHARLSDELGEKRRGGGEKVTVSKSAPIPVNTAVDALMRDITETLVSWHERVADIARLSFPGGDLSRRRRDHVAVEAAVTALSGHLDALLALPPQPMWRTADDSRELEDLDGAAAGLEILHLHYLCRRLLGETRARAETFDGIPCRECEDIALEHAEPPSDPDEHAPKSRCASCGDVMDDEEFEAWADRYSTWAESAMPACRRCQRGDHEQCAWQACPCRSVSHAAAA